ncbi:MAG: cell division protein FtsZ, partial [Polyangia bacterium]
IPNDRLLSIAGQKTTMLDAFRKADEVLLNAVQGISDLITIPGLINVDFADVRTIMKEMGRALMGMGRACGERRAIEAAQQAISSPLLEDVSITGATGILINITGGPDLTLFEVNEASTLIQEAAHEDANIIFGSVIDANFVDEVRITVIATGFDRAVAHMDDPIIHAPIERKRATQIAMPYTGVPAAARPHVPPTQSPRHEQQVEMRTQQAMREQQTRPDQTPMTAPMRTDAPPQSRAERAAQQKVDPRLSAALSGAEETELDIPAFLRHPLRSVE